MLFHQPESNVMLEVHDMPSSSMVLYRSYLNKMPAPNKESVCTNDMPSSTAIVNFPQASQP